MIQERSYSSAILLEIPSFQNIWKKKIWFFVQWDAFKTTSKKIFKKTAEITGNLSGNKSTDKITSISKTSQQNNSEAVTNEHNKEIPK